MACHPRQLPFRGRALSCQRDEKVSFGDNLQSVVASYVLSPQPLCPFPHSRVVLQEVLDTDLSNEAFPFSTHKLATAAGCTVGRGRALQLPGRSVHWGDRPPACAAEHPLLHPPPRCCCEQLDGFVGLFFCWKRPKTGVLSSQFACRVPSCSPSPPGGVVARAELGTW